MGIVPRGGNEELRLILSESAAGGQVSRRERLMMENVLDLEDKVTRQVMVDPSPCATMSGRADGAVVLRVSDHGRAALLMRCGWASRSRDSADTH